jgi:protein-tyrosine phosphatase
MLDADEISPGLWQGSVPPRGRKLRKAGFDVVVLAAREWQLYDDVFEDIEVIRAPLDDKEVEPITRNDLRGALQAARQVAEAVAQGKKCLVTCAAGLNRSGLVTALTLHLLHGWSGARCAQQVRKMRTWPRPDYSPLSNEQFLAILGRLPSRQG